jgi:SAM-dependent methyltransferase
MAKNVWKDLHQDYRTRDWIDKPSIFAEQILDLLPHSGDLLELGAGLGQDSRFFAEAGYNVIATDLEATILDVDKSRVSPDIQSRIQFQQMDLRQPFPIDDASFDIVYAHLSIHYFNNVATHAIFDEVFRVLKPGGVFVYLANSTDDPEYGAGTVLEPDYYLIEDNPKRYFSISSAQEFAEKFETILLDNKGETYKDRAKGVHNLIRYIGKKPL